MIATSRSATIHSRIAAAAVTVLAAVVAPASAAQRPDSPIDLQSCAVVYAASPEQVYAMGMRLPEGVRVAFVNRTAVAIDDVRFAFGDGLDAIDVDDRGSFAPGAVIRHEFASGDRPITTCRVIAVRFAGAPAFATIGPVTTASR